MMISKWCKVTRYDDDLVVKLYLKNVGTHSIRLFDSNWKLILLLMARETDEVKFTDRVDHGYVYFFFCCISWTESKGTKDRVPVWWKLKTIMMLVKKKLKQKGVTNWDKA